MPNEPVERAFAVPVDHPAFAGHFPGTPILPGALLLDAVVRLAPNAGTGVSQIAAAKFFSPVVPGEQLIVSYVSTADAGLRWAIACGARQVASGMLVVAP